MALVNTAVEVKGVESLKDIMEKLGNILSKYNIVEEDINNIFSLLAPYFLEIKEIPNML